MAERQLRCGADGCHFTCCCKSREQRLGCLQRHVIWHLKKYETIPLPPLSTVQLVDREVVRSALQSLPQGTLPKNEENKNENLHETEVTSSSCDEDKNEQIKENRNKATKPSVTAAGGARVPQNATLNFYVLEEHPSSVSQSKSNKIKNRW